MSIADTTQTSIQCQFAIYSVDTWRQGPFHKVLIKKNKDAAHVCRLYSFFPIVSPVLLRFCWRVVWKARDRVSWKPHRCARPWVRARVSSSAARHFTLLGIQRSSAGESLTRPQNTYSAHTHPSRPADHRQVSVRPRWASFRGVSRGAGVYFTGVWKQCAERGRARGGRGFTGHAKHALALWEQAFKTH